MLLLSLFSIAALVVSLFRNIIAINTFGTFMPVLIALAYRNTKLGWGLALFSMFVILGLISRCYLNRRKLLLVPRLAVIVTVIIIIILAVGSVFCAHRGLCRIMAVALFPMVIMTMTIERLSIILMERGVREAIMVAVGTFFYCLVQLFSNVKSYYPRLLFCLPGSPFWPDWDADPDWPLYWLPSHRVFSIS